MVEVRCHAKQHAAKSRLAWFPGVCKLPGVSTKFYIGRVLIRKFVEEG